MRRFLLGCAFALTALAAAAQTPPSSPPPSPEILARIAKGGIDDYILGAYANLEATTDRFAKTISAYCSSPSFGAMRDLGPGFGELLAAWAGVDFLQFGPMSRENRADRFAFWPDPHGTGERQLREWMATQDAAPLAPGAIARQSAAIQGLPALERLLYEANRGLTIAGPPERYRCGLAEAVSANLLAIATATRAEWGGDNGWRALMLAPQHDNPVYIKPDEPVVELLKALIAGIERLSDQRIQPARGPGLQFAKSSRAPYAISGETTRYWRASADALQRFAAALRIGDALPSANRALASSADAEFAKLKSALGAAGSSLDDAIFKPGPRAKLGDALAALKALRDLYGTTIPGASGLTTGFNALDGD